MKAGLERLDSSRCAANSDWQTTTFRFQKILFDRTFEDADGSCRSRRRQRRQGTIRIRIKDKCKMKDRVGDLCFELAAAPCGRDSQQCRHAVCHPMRAWWAGESAGLGLHPSRASLCDAPQDEFGAPHGEEGSCREARCKLGPVATARNNSTP